MPDKVEEPIWVVADANFPTRISYIHHTEANAKDEATRLARSFHHKFIVFKSVCAVEINDIVVTKYEDGCDIPF